MADPESGLPARPAQPGLLQSERITYFLRGDFKDGEGVLRRAAKTTVPRGRRVGPGRGLRRESKTVARRPRNGVLLLNSYDLKISSSPSQRAAELSKREIHLKSRTYTEMTVWFCLESVAPECKGELC